MRKLAVVAALLLTSCASGPVAGTSAIAHSVGAVVIEALPPGFHTLGEIAVNALIQLSEANGWTREQFVTACQQADISVGDVPGQPRAIAQTPDPKAVALASAYLAKLRAAGR